jgi:hypothetical protein
MQRENSKMLFTEKIKAGGRTYFFDFKETHNGNRYLAISEMRLVGDRNERDRIVIYEEYLESFFDSLQKVIDFTEK